jgi:hypothetical protein
MRAVGVRPRLAGSATSLHRPRGHAVRTAAICLLSRAIVDDPNERVKWALRRLYYRQRRFRDVNGGYTASISALHAADIRVDGVDFRPLLHATPSLYEMTAAGFDGPSSTSTRTAAYG